MIGLGSLISLLVRSKMISLVFFAGDFLEDDHRLKSLLEQRIRHLVKHAGFLSQQGGKFFSWIRHDSDGSACLASTLLDESLEVVHLLAT